MRYVLGFALVGALSFYVGVWAAASSEGLRNGFNEAKFAVRDALGVAKEWQPTPRLGDYEPRQEVACPSPNEAVLLATGGQSNAANALSTRSARPDGSRSVVFYEGRCYPLEDPVLGATNDGGSLWVEFGAALEKEIGRPIVFVNGAVSGTRFSDWNDRRSGFLDALLQTTSDAMERGYRSPLILWHQGETDAGGLDDIAAFKADVRDLLSTLLSDLPGSSLYLFQTSRCKATIDGVPAITEALREVGQEFDRVTVGMDTDQLDREYRHDTCHFNSLGRTAIVRAAVPEVAEVIRQTRPAVIGRASTSSPTRQPPP